MLTLQHLSAKPVDMVLRPFNQLFLLCLMKRALDPIYFTLPRRNQFHS